MKYKFAFMIFLFLSVRLLSLNFGMQSQASAWSTLKSLDESDNGFRYIPEAVMKVPVSSVWSFDAEVSLNMYNNWLYSTNRWIQKDNLKPYRIYARLSSAQFECRIGLQKINFGPARMLRSLMWFDKIDPRDPLQITDGVYAALIRYYFQNNANIWLWGLTGNSDPKGMEVMATKKKTLESGGRVQFPAGPGEIGLTLHHRKIDPQNLLPVSGLRFPVSDYSEYRIALDARYDIEAGLWTEAAVTYQDWDLLPYPYRKFITLGADYTVNIGNGLYIQAEHMQIELSKDWDNSTIKQDLSAVSMNCSTGLVDNFTGILYYDWDGENLYRFIRWQRSYDRWQFHLMAFWNPADFNLPQVQTDGKLFTGKGIQIMVVFNH